MSPAELAYMSGFIQLVIGSTILTIGVVMLAELAKFSAK